MKGHTLGRAPNYTNAFLVSAYVVLVIVLVTIWATWGYGAALLVAFASHMYLARKLLARETPVQARRS